MLSYFYIVSIILMAILAVVVRFFTVFIHELGHAIPVYFLTRKKVIIYIGSYGERDNNFSIDVGIFKIYFHFRVFIWNMGLCVPPPVPISLNGQIVYTLMGPLASTLLATVACYFTFAYDWTGLWELFLIIFLGSAVMDLIVNLSPDPRPVFFYGEKSVYNDGYQLIDLIRFKKFLQKYKIEYSLFVNNTFEAAAAAFEKVATRDSRLYVRRFYIWSLYYAKNYKKLIDVINSNMTKNFNSDDFAVIGSAYVESMAYNESLIFLGESLKLNRFNKFSLNNKGYAYIMLGKYENAIIYFDLCIEQDKNFAYAYSNRGLAKIKAGQIEEGYDDLVRSQELNPDNSYVYLHFGVYYLEKHDYVNSLKNLYKARKIDPDTHQVEALILEVLAQIDQASLAQVNAEIEAESSRPEH